MARYTKEERKKLRALKRLSSARDSEFEGFITHSTMYHRVFEGYSERQVPKENGRGMRIERVYVGDYFERSEAGLSQNTAKMIYTLLYFVSVACAILAFTRSTGYNNVWYGVIPMFALIILLILFLVNLGTCLFAPRKMELYHYNAFGKLMQASLRTAAASLAYALLSVVYMVLNGAARDTWPVTLCALLIGALFFTIFSLERRAFYNVTENENQPEHDSVVIC